MGPACGCDKAVTAFSVVIHSSTPNDFGNVCSTIRSSRMWKNEQRTGPMFAATNLFTKLLKWLHLWHCCGRLRHSRAQIILRYFCGRFRYSRARLIIINLHVAPLVRTAPTHICTPHYHSHARSHGSESTCVVRGMCQRLWRCGFHQRSGGVLIRPARCLASAKGCDGEDFKGLGEALGVFMRGVWRVAREVVVGLLWMEKNRCGSSCAVYGA